MQEEWLSASETLSLIATGMGEYRARIAIARHNGNNERIKRAYFAYLKEARR